MLLLVVVIGLDNVGVHVGRVGKVATAAARVAATAPPTGKHRGVRHLPQPRRRVPWPRLLTGVCVMHFRPKLTLDGLAFAFL